MTGSYLLDTNIAIDLLAGGPQGDVAFDRVADVLLPTVVFGELQYGALKSERCTENLERLDLFALHVAMVDIDMHTARTYGIVKNGLRAKGCPIPDNDIWIAALALQLDCTLVTRDRHFAAVDGLKMESWCEA